MFETVEEALESERFPTDEELEQLSYGVKYFSFGFSLEYTRQRRAKLVKMQQRLKELEEQKVTQQNNDTRTICDCGHKADFPMTTSNGTSCPRCYDRMSSV